MAKNGKAKVLTSEEFIHLISNIENHRHPEKNQLIIQLSFKLGLRVQELSLLRITEVAEITDGGAGFKLKNILILPKSFTKGARAKTAKATSSENSKRTSVRFTIGEFERLVERIQTDALAGKETSTEDYYPELKARGGRTRELPIVDTDLISAIARYLKYRISKGETLKPHAPLVLSQKGGAYIPNTLQDHMRKMMRQWCGIERASSHSGRRGLATEIIHHQGRSLATAQQVLGHKHPSTTAIYEDVPEETIAETMEEAGKILKID